MTRIVNSNCVSTNIEIEQMVLRTNLILPLHQISKSKYKRKKVNSPTRKKNFFFVEKEEEEE